MSDQPLIVDVSPPPPPTHSPSLLLVPAPPPSQLPPAVKVSTDPPSVSSETISQVVAFLQKLSVEVMCSTCSNLFESPKLLECMHTLCESCIEGMTSIEKEVSCPTCHTVHRLGAQGAASLPTNSFVARLVTRLEIALSPCGECGSANSVFYCEHCGASLCESCHRRIHDLKVNRSHYPLRVDLFILEHPRYACESHPQSSLELFCNTCRVVVCPHCVMSGHHKGHECCPIQKAFEDNVSSTKAYLQQATNRALELESMRNDISNALEKLKTDATDAESTVSDYFSKLRYQLDLKEKEIIDAINQSRDSKIARLQQFSKRLSIGQDQIVNIKEFDEELNFRSSNIEYLMTKPFLDMRILAILSRKWGGDLPCDPNINISLDNNLIDAIKGFEYSCSDTVSSEPLSEYYDAPSNENTNLSIQEPSERILPIPNVSHNELEFSDSRFLNNESLKWKDGLYKVRDLTGHSGTVFCLSIDGETVFSGSSDNTIRMWDTSSGACKGVLLGHSRSVVCLARSGKFLVSGAGDCDVRVWDATSGECVRTLRGHSGWIRCVATEGYTVVSGSADGTLRIFNYFTGNCEHILVGHDRPVGVVVLDRGIIFSGGSDGTVRVWNVENGECLRVLEGHSAAVGCLKLIKESKILVSGSGDKTLRIWCLETGRTLSVLSGHSDTVWCVGAYKMDGFDRIVSGSTDNTLKIWTVNGECVSTLAVHTDAVWCLYCDDHKIISGSNDKTIRVWDSRDGSHLYCLDGHRDAVWSLYCTKTTLFSGSGDRTVRVWKV